MCTFFIPNDIFFRKKCKFSMNEQGICLPTIADGEDKSSPFKNCIRNNYRHIRKWAKRTNTNCFRIYDREIASFPLAIDFYGGRYCVHYFSRSREADEPPPELVEEVCSVLSSLFHANADSIYWRTRVKREKTEQYEKIGKSKKFFPVLEYGVQFLINLTDYLDTGLFLDHREMRRLVAAEAKGKRILNLFSYTGSFSVHASRAGATHTKSVDMSNTYNAWAEENFLLNSLSLKTNEIVRADCLTFLQSETGSYDIIVIDPPTISRSKKMSQMFDIQEDYVFLINKSLPLLKKNGVIYFSTNSRKFVFDPSLFPNCNAQEITNKTFPIDFHRAKIHKSWKITMRS